MTTSDTSIAFSDRIVGSPRYPMTTSPPTMLPAATVPITTPIQLSSRLAQSFHHINWQLFYDDYYQPTAPVTAVAIGEQVALPTTKGRQHYNASRRCAYFIKRSPPVHIFDGHANGTSTAQTLEQVYSLHLFRLSAFPVYYMQHEFTACHYIPTDAALAVRELVASCNYDRIKQQYDDAMASKSTPATTFATLGVHDWLEYMIAQGFDHVCDHRFGWILEQLKVHDSQQGNTTARMSPDPLPTTITPLPEYASIIVDYGDYNGYYYSGTRCILVNAERIVV